VTERPSPRVLLVAGARPNFMKVAPILAQLERGGSQVILVHTGQHYSPELSDNILRDLDIREPDFNLGVGSGTHAQQTAHVMETFEPVLLQTRPDWVVVVGDVNSTLACSLVTAKLKEETGTRLAHVEAGLRSDDWRMPEEINRVITDRLSDLLLTPSRDAAKNLVAEGIRPDRIVFVGNVMIDTLLMQLPKARALNTGRALGLQERSYIVVTLHRPSNVDSRETLQPILEGLAAINAEARVVLPMHPRTRKNAEVFGLGRLLDELLTLRSLGYLEMLSLTDGAVAVLTDSGGLQEETTALGIPCVTLREQTERPITLTEGTNRMAQWPLTAGGLLDSFKLAKVQGRLPVGSRCPEGWDGSASTRIVSALQGAPSPRT
jgi:UDP-N-acetylglucosamine 2-epimerase (non-hydrolysing)